jgi:hypothetical protein
VGPARAVREQSSPQRSWFDDLRRPDRPASRVRGPLATLLPAPTTTLEAWERYVHADLPALTDAEARHELEQLRVAVALVGDLDAVPLWARDRVWRLAERCRRAA